MPDTSVIATALISFIAVIWTGALGADEPGIKRSILLKTPLTGVYGRQLVLGVDDLPPGAASGTHYHDGDEVIYVLEGAAVLELHGHPPVVLDAGQSHHIPAGLPHDVKNIGPSAGKSLVIFVVDPARPLAVSVPPAPM